MIKLLKSIKSIRALLIFSINILTISAHAWGPFSTNQAPPPNYSITWATVVRMNCNNGEIISFNPTERPINQVFLSMKNPNVPTTPYNKANGYTSKNIDLLFHQGIPLSIQHRYLNILSNGEVQIRARADEEFFKVGKINFENACADSKPGFVKAKCEKEHWADADGKSGVERCMTSRLKSNAENGFSVLLPIDLYSDTEVSLVRTKPTCSNPWFGLDDSNTRSSDYTMTLVSKNQKLIYPLHTISDNFPNKKQCVEFEDHWIDL